jgi:acyl-CoA thioester hydrolase
MPFVQRVQVPYFQVDQQGVVFNMWYLAWFDEAMTAYLGEIGFPYDALMRAGIDVQLVHTELDWTDGVRFGDDVGVEVTTHEIGRTSFTLGFRVLRGDAAPVVAKTVYVVIRMDGSGKTSVPPDLRAALGG